MLRGADQAPSHRAWTMRLEPPENPGTGMAKARSPTPRRLCPAEDLLVQNPGGDGDGLARSGALDLHLEGQARPAKDCGGQALQRQGDRPEEPGRAATASTMASATGAGHGRWNRRPKETSRDPFLIPGNTGHPGIQNP